jgi:hypothetical protein
LVWAIDILLDGTKNCGAKNEPAETVVPGTAAENDGGIMACLMEVGNDNR